MSKYPRWQKKILEQALASRRIVMLTGPRQCGKTTLARELVSSKAAYRTLDDVGMKQAAESDQHLFVSSGPKDGTLIIDEIQKVPDILPAIKKMVDDDDQPGQFLITGSANILSLPTVTESLAGRVGKIRLRPLSQGEILKSQCTFLEHAFEQTFNMPFEAPNQDTLTEMMFRGGFPEATRLQGKMRRSWHIDYIDALIEHDLNDIANIKQTDLMKDLVRVLAAWSSKNMNIAAISAGLAADRRTLANYFSALQAFYIIESVPAWRKTDYDRVGKQAKLFLTDTGMMTALLGWKTADLVGDPDKPGKLFETFVFNELSALIDASDDVYHLYQYRDREKREIDFLIERDDLSLLAIEVKSGLTVKKMHFKHIEWFRDNLAKDRTVIGIVLYAGDEILPFGENLWAVPVYCLWR